MRLELEKASLDEIKSVRERKAYKNETKEFIEFFLAQNEEVMRVNFKEKYRNADACRNSFCNTIKKFSLHAKCTKVNGSVYLINLELGRR